MALNVNGYTNRFQVFADFAQKSVEAGDKKAIANAARMQTSPGKSSFVVVASQTDKVGGIFTRSAKEMSANEATRTIFLKEVVKIFGGSEKVPENVRKALNLIDYGRGQPLTARRIMAVKAAIDEFHAAQKGGAKNPVQAGREVMKAATTQKTAAAKKAANPDMKPLKISIAKAKEMIAASAKLQNLRLDDETADAAARLLKDYGNKLPAKTARVLANFIVNTAVEDGLDEKIVKNLAKDMKKWREFDFGDKRFAKMGQKFVQRQNNYVKQQLADPSRFSPKNPDVFQQVYADADRGVWTVNGETFKVGSNPNTVVDKICSALKTSNARKVVSSLLHQGALADLETVFSRGEALVGDSSLADLQTETLYTLPGGDRFIHRNVERDGFGILADADVRYQLEVSKDGKTATLTLGVEKHISTAGTKAAENRIGKATITQKTVIDLTKDMPEVVGVTFSQTFTPDEINKSA